MDVIVLAKESYKSAALPQVIYCGKSRIEAREVIASVGGKFKWIYEVSSLPIRNYKTASGKTEPAAAVESDAVATGEQPEIESPKKKKSK